MLQRLYIKNFALIEEIAVEFSDHFNVLTGETGAGKSIVIDAVSLLLGGRAQAEFIRFGKDAALLEGVFYLPPEHSVFQLLTEFGISSEEQTIVLTREISAGGKNSQRVNGRTLTLTQYRQVGLLIVDIHGQHDHQALLQVEHHVGILDRFAGAEHLLLAHSVREYYKKWQAVKTELADLRRSEQERLQRVEFLKFQAGEIKQAKLRENEDEELKQEAAILANAEKIQAQMQKAYGCLFGGERGSSAYELVGQALGSLADIKKVDAKLAKLAEELEPSLYIIEEAAAVARDYLENIEFSPVKLEQIEKRLQQIKDLNKKYGATIGDILQYAQKAEEELAYWENSAALTEKLEAEVQAYWRQYEEKAAGLSAGRKEVASLLENRVKLELAELAMPNTKFSVRFTASEASAQGMEKVEFLISPNPGEPLLPVAKIASGGELSRIILAIKTIIADQDEIGTLIFDEIDSGIGGKAAQKLAEKLEKISISQQVICVTHAPLISAPADRHLLLEKEIIADRTQTSLRVLTTEERVNELVRMLGGEKPTEDLRKYARQILKL
ncbi:MAG: DNA repair protein RecN [Clostridia bacterium]|jgi:DNA repair protein RecN (Recombination protein N)|nr:DNA repair protein RecN [Clostridia bacterium]